MSMYPLEKEKGWDLFGIATGLATTRMVEVTNDNLNIFDYKYLTFLFYNMSRGPYLIDQASIPVQLIKRAYAEMPYSEGDCRLMVTSNIRGINIHFCIFLRFNAVDTFNEHKLTLDIGANAEFGSDSKCKIYLHD